MPSVASQAVSLNRIPAISSVVYSNTITATVSNFGQSTGAANSFTAIEASEPYQKLVALTYISKTSGGIINSMSLSLMGSTCELINSYSSSTYNLYTHWTNYPRTSGTFSSYAYSLVGQQGQTGITLNISIYVFMLNGGSGPYTSQTGASVALDLGAQDFINNTAAVLAVSSATSITGITNPVSRVGAQTFTAGSTVNLSTSGVMAAVVFK